MTYRQPPLFVNPGNHHAIVDPPPPPWKNSPCWGQNVVLQTVFTGGNPDLSVPREILKLPDSGRPPQQMTIDTALFNEIGATNEYNLVGILRYGAGGGIQEVEFDWLNGVQLSVVTNSIMVLLRIEGLHGGVPSVPVDVSVSALVGFGTRGNGTIPQRTIYPTVVPTDLVSIPIPDRARRVIIYDAAHIYANTVSFAAQSGSGISLVTFDWSQLQAACAAGQGFVLPAGSQNLLLNNQSGLTITPAVIFQLDL